MFEFHLSFSDIFSVFTDWLNIIISATTLGVAIYAVNTWKKEKIYDIETKAISAIIKMTKSIVNLINVSSDIVLLSVEQQRKVEEAASIDNDTKELLAMYFSYENRIANFKEVDDNLKEIAILVMQQSNNKHLINLYRFYYITQLNYSVKISSYLIDFRMRHLDMLAGTKNGEYILSNKDFNELDQLANSGFKKIIDEFTLLSREVNSTFLNRVVN